MTVDRGLWISGLLLNWLGLGMMPPIAWFALTTGQWFGAVLSIVATALAATGVAAFWAQRENA